MATLSRPWAEGEATDVEAGLCLQTFIQLVIG